VLEDFLTREIEELDRLVERVIYQAMKKKPKRVEVEEVAKACAGV